MKLLKLTLRNFEGIPVSAEDVKDRYRTLAKEKHPDRGGGAEEFQQLAAATEVALQYLAERGER
jgi:DnaJ-class molecular chaperone